jgi:hypothetical protein
MRFGSCSCTIKLFLPAVPAHQTFACRADGACGVRVSTGPFTSSWGSAVARRVTSFVTSMLAVFIPLRLCCVVSDVGVFMCVCGIIIHSIHCTRPEFKSRTKGRPLISFLHKSPFPNIRHIHIQSGVHRHMPLQSPKRLTLTTAIPLVQNPDAPSTQPMSSFPAVPLSL